MFIFVQTIVMNTKLTLTMEQSVIEKAKSYALKKQRSLSDLIESYLIAVTKETSINNEVEISPLVKSLQGSFSIDDSIDYKQELTKALHKKYI
jgi:hypothetical protein